MAKKKITNNDGELGGYAPAAPGIHEPFVVPEGGHEGARAAWELANMTEGRFAKAGEFVDYDDALKISKSV
jgi:hypothetical protein